MESENDAFTGLAYHMEGAMTLLLDGHHRASAACLSNKQVNCLVIAKVSGIGWVNEKIQYLWVGGTGLDLTQMVNDDKIIKLTKKYKVKKSGSRSKKRKYWLSGEIKDYELKEPLNTKAKLYPLYRDIALESTIDIISFQRYEELWDKYDDESIYEFEILTRALFRRNKEEMYFYLVKIVGDKNKSDFWEQAYNLLITYEEDRIEDVLVNYLVEYDYDKSDPIRQIIDVYYEKRV